MTNLPEPHGRELNAVSTANARDPRDGYTADEMNAMVRGDTSPAALPAVGGLSDADLLALASPRPWYFDGWDIFSTGPTDDTGGHRCVVPLPHNTFHPSQHVSKYDAELIVRAVNAYREADRG